MKSVRTPTLELAYEEHGPADGPPVILMHGFPYDPRCFDEVAPPLAKDGCRVLVPYMRGYGPTRFLSPDTPRSGEQAAFGNDLLQFMDALAIERATLMGYDWGGRGACVVSALWPERVRGPGELHRLQHPGHRGLGEAGRGRAGAPPLVPVLFQHAARRSRADPEPARRLPAAVEAVVAALAVRRGDLRGERRRRSTIPTSCRWSSSPIAIATATRRAIRRSSASRRKLQAQPTITVPTINLHGDADGVGPASDRDGGSAQVHRRLRAAHDRPGRPQRAAGSARRKPSPRSATS